MTRSLAEEEVAVFGYHPEGLRCWPQSLMRDLELLRPQGSGPVKMRYPRG